MLSNSEAEKIKEHLLKQLENFPESQRNTVKEKINSMSHSDLEEFIKQNQLNHLNDDEAACIFCKITKGEIQSYKIAENENNIAILEINPLDNGHTLIIPKKHSSKTISDETEKFAKIVSKRLQERLAPKEIKIEKNQILGHSILEIIPTYGGQKIERKKAPIEELKKIQEYILKEEKKIEEIKQPKTPEPLPKLKIRLP